MPLVFRLLALAAAAVFVVAQAGCSISDSISASVKSSSSPFKWSSASSPDGEDGADVEDSDDAGSSDFVSDVRDYTVTYVQTGAELTAFGSGVGRVAERHGISNWEAERDSYLAIGRGLRKAGVKPDELEAYKAALSPDDALRAQEIQTGYDQAGG